jgi:hypothetical protein
LLLLRWKKMRRRNGGNQDYLEKDRLSFADRGAEFMREAGGSAGGNYNNGRSGSHSSMSIMNGKLGAGHKRGLGALGSDASTAPLTKSPLAYHEPVEMSHIAEKTMPIVAAAPVALPKPAPTRNEDVASREPQHGHSRSSGWSRYFANNEATNLANMNSTRSTFASESDGSLYSSSRVISQPSQAVPPLDLSFGKFDGQRLSRVATGSPTLGHSREDLRGQPMQAQLSRAGSVGSSVSSVDEYETASVTKTTSWTPVGASHWNQRPASSTYTGSNRGSEMPKDGASSNYPNDNTSSFYYKNGISTLYGLYGNQARGPADGRDSTVTVFPGANTGRPSTSSRPDIPPPPPSDMSWLNLGANSSHSS